ncbi:MAG: radical SAM protein [Anaerolineae bacterium]|nr:radical SAM protein [Anaerolineae bacterium]
MAFSLGIGLTSDCNLECPHCYRPTDRVYALSLSDVQAVCQSLEIRSAGLGTGENALHPDFRRIVAYLNAQGIRLSMASNGYSLNTMTEEELRCFHDVEVSIDFPREEEQDRFRGSGNWRDVHRAMERCQALGIEVSILTTMMNINHDQMAAMARLAHAQGVNLRVNVYQPVQNGRYTLSYEQFWTGFRELFGASTLLSCTEPVVRAVLGMDGVRSPCGYESVRVTPQRQVAPCVYWPGSSLTIEDLTRLGGAVLETPQFEQARRVPSAAADCPCQGGCASRRALLGTLDAHDPYCPWIRGDRITLDVSLAPEKELVRARNYCTTIVM